MKTAFPIARMHAETQLVSAAEEPGEHLVLRVGPGRIWRTHWAWADLQFLPHSASDRVEAAERLFVAAVPGLLAPCQPSAVRSGILMAWYSVYSLVLAGNQAQPLKRRVRSGTVPRGPLLVVGL